VGFVSVLSLFSLGKIGKICKGFKRVLFYSFFDDDELLPPVFIYSVKTIGFKILRFVVFVPMPASGALVKSTECHFFNLQELVKIK